MGMYPQDNLYLSCLLSYTTKYELNRSCHILALIWYQVGYDTYLIFLLTVLFSLIFKDIQIKQKNR